MPTVEVVDPSMFPQVLPLLRSMNRSMDDATWSRLFQYPWASDRSERGWMLVDDGGQPVGFLGAVFSERFVEGQERRFCNLTTWYVHPDHRASSLALMRPVLRIRDRTITDMSPADDVVRISRRLGFKDLDSGVRLLGRPPRGRSGAVGAATLHVDDPSSSALLGAEARKVFDDHEGVPGCHRIVIVAGGSSCLVVCKRVGAGVEPYSHIHHVSDPALFLQHYAQVRRCIRRVTGTKVLLIDARFEWARIPGSRVLPEWLPKLYRPCDDLQPQQIDNLYSELALLEFSQLPASGIPLRARLRNKVARSRSNRRDQRQHGGASPDDN